MVTSASVLPSFVRIETALGRELTPHPGTQLQRGRPPGGLEPPEHGRAGEGGSRKAGSAEPWVRVGGEVRKLRKTRGRTARPPPPLGRAGRAAPRADGGPGAPTSPRRPRAPQPSSRACAPGPEHPLAPSGKWLWTRRRRPGRAVAAGRPLTLPSHSTPKPSVRATLSGGLTGAARGPCRVRRSKRLRSSNHPLKSFLIAKLSSFKIRGKSYPPKK